MRNFIPLLGGAIFSLILVLGCGKPEEPAKAGKPEAKPPAAVETKPAEEPKPAAEQKAEAAKGAPAPDTAEPKKEPAQQGHAKKEPAQQEVKHQEQAKPEHPKPESAKPAGKHEPPAGLKKALLAYLAKTGTDPKYAEPRQTALIDLNGDGRQDALVLLENPMYFCGTGGCTMLVFKGSKTGFAFVSRTTLVRGPVLVSEGKTHGWRDLIFEVSGGGMAPKTVALKFTGSKYPLNPSMQPPLPRTSQLRGTKVF